MWKLRIAAIAAVMLGITGCGAAKYDAKQGGGEEQMQKVQQGQPMYQPPAGAPVPPPTGTGGAPGGAPGYSLQPPPR
jgi:hypothetical protein